MRQLLLPKLSSTWLVFGLNLPRGLNIVRTKPPSCCLALSQVTSWVLAFQTPDYGCMVGKCVQLIYRLRAVLVCCSNAGQASFLNSFVFIVSACDSVQQLLAFGALHLLRPSKWTDRFYWHHARPSATGFCSSTDLHMRIKICKPFWYIWNTCKAYMFKKNKKIGIWFYSVANKKWIINKSHYYYSFYLLGCTWKPLCWTAGQKAFLQSSFSWVSPWIQTVHCTFCRDHMLLVSDGISNISNCSSRELYE